MHEQITSCLGAHAIRAENRPALGCVARSKGSQEDFARGPGRAPCGKGAPPRGRAQIASQREYFISNREIGQRLPQLKTF